MANLLSGKVIVADDELFSQSIVVRLVKEIGANDILRASDGKETLQQLETDFGQEISLIILDINMPKLNGLQVLKMIRTNAIECNRAVPVIMLTGNTDMELVSAALALDADSFLAKPVSKEALKQRVAALASEERHLKTVEEYREVDIDAALKFQKEDPADKPVKGKLFKDPAEKKRGRRYPRADVPEGAVVAEPIFTSNGQILIGAGVALNGRLKRKLDELASVGESIPFVWVEE